MAITVLLVDDARDFTDYTSRRLTARGMEVYVAYRGEEALDLLEAQSIDVVVLDVLMPGPDGIDVLREMRARHPKLPVVMLTGHGTVAAAGEGKKLGAVAFLLKPCDFDELLAAIQDAAACAERDA